MFSSSAMKTTKKRQNRRTHMMFASAANRAATRARRMTVSVGEKSLKALQQMQQQQYVLSERDVAVQTVSQLDPHQWTGNQRVIHFGPMAQRDPFYYYYPKGWDILYPAHFGFFPYRTKKSRGTSPIVCLVAFGLFFAAGGATMTYLIYSRTIEHYLRDQSDARPLKIAGPTLLAFGGFCLLVGFLWWLFSLQLCDEKLRHTQPHHVEPRKIYVEEQDDEDAKLPINVTDTSPFLPPPPLTILANSHTEASFYKPISEMKLFPPVIPGAGSSISAARSNLSFNIRSATPSRYNTLTSNYSKTTTMKRIDSAGSYEYEAWPEYHGSKINPLHGHSLKRGI